MKILVDIFRKCRALALCGMVTVCEKLQNFKAAISL